MVSLTVHGVARSCHYLVNMPQELVAAACPYYVPVREYTLSELESAAQRNCFLEKENEQLKQELAYLKAKICALKAQSIDRKSSLRKKLSNTPFDGGNETSLQLKQQIAHINSREDCPRVYEGSLSASDPLETNAKVEKLPQVVPVPPPAPTSAAPKTAALPIDYANEKTVPGPPAPPPLPSKLLPRSVNIVRRVPEVMEFYRTITKKHNKADNKNSFQGIIPASANARNMIGEIENRSTYLLAVSTEAVIIFTCSTFTHHWES
ncbi:hypothetical protein Scep_005707 [Stephania cephalantha]|uniref:Uncharacterized protein n=1 Tax=Stephania cephalantha TaxID=152367 RepID=A0AAP0KUS8_9MAGN